MLQRETAAVSWRSHLGNTSTPECSWQTIHMGSHYPLPWILRWKQC